MKTIIKKYVETLKIKIFRIMIKILGGGKTMPVPAQ